MIDNAISHYLDMRDQGLSPDAAALHTRQRFGVSEADLAERLDGGVADREATRAALGEAKEILSGDWSGMGTDALEVLDRLYTAITGESL